MSDKGVERSAIYNNSKCEKFGRFAHEAMPATIARPRQ
jgi:hypothetical protein